jgi:hypothetical protein
MFGKSAQIRVVRPFAHFAKGWGIARSATVFLCIAAIVSGAAKAQTAPCGLTSITENAQFSYPPIARAAHVQGAIILLVQFALDGKPTHISAVSGPLMLQGAAIDFVKGWQANTYTGPRECPIVIQFALGKESEKPKITAARIDFQHVLITAEVFPPPSIQYATATK